jgi:hypothetical protein
MPALHPSLLLKMLCAEVLHTKNCVRCQRTLAILVAITYQVDRFSDSPKLYQLVNLRPVLTDNEGFDTMVGGSRNQLGPRLVS